MRIFKLEGKKVIVSNYSPNIEKLIEFKKKEIATIPQDERVLSAERDATPASNKSYSIKREKDELVCFENLLYKNSNDKYHLLECSKLSEEEQTKIIAKYIKWRNYYGYEPHAIETPYEELKPTYKKDRIDFATFIDNKSKQTLRNLRYFLTSDNYAKQDNRFIERMEGIININKALYLYHLLITEQYDMLIDKDIEEQLRLFDKQEVVCEFNMNEIGVLDRNLAKVGIIIKDNNYNKLMDQVKRSEHVLKLINKINN